VSPVVDAIGVAHSVLRSGPEKPAVGAETGAGAARRIAVQLGSTSVRIGRSSRLAAVSVQNWCRIAADIRRPTTAWAVAAATRRREALTRIARAVITDLPIRALS
jgi:hypothetical protein